MNNKLIAINKLNAQTQAIRILAVTCFVLLVMLFSAHNKILNIPKDYNIWIPPDITGGGFASLNEPYKIHVLNFALLIHQGIYTWDENGQEEFPLLIDRYRNYISNNFRKTLKSRAVKAGNSYKNRVRKLHFDYSKNNHHNVERLGNGKWRVTLAIRVKDSIADNEMKDAFIKYSYDIDTVTVSRKANPFGLIISGEFSESKRMVK